MGRRTGLWAHHDDVYIHLSLQLLGLGFLLLALVPRRPVRWTARLARAGGPRGQWIGALGVVLVAITVGAWVRSDIDATGALLARQGRLTKIELAVISTGEEVVPEDQRLPYRFLSLDPAEVRRVVDHYGDPVTSPEALDQVLVDRVEVRALGPRGEDVACTDTTDAMEWVPRGLVPLQLSSDADVWEVEVRVYGEDWLPVGPARAGEILQISAPPLMNERPWQAHGEGICRIPVLRP